MTTETTSDYLPLFRADLEELADQLRCEVRGDIARTRVFVAALAAGCPPERCDEVARDALARQEGQPFNVAVAEAIRSLTPESSSGRHSGEVPRLPAPGGTVVAVEFADAGPDLAWRGPESAPTAVGVAAVVSVPREAAEEPAVEAAAAPAAEVGTRERAEPQKPVQAVTAIPHISEWTEPPAPGGEGGAA